MGNSRASFASGRGRGFAIGGHLGRGRPAIFFGVCKRIGLCFFFWMIKMIPCPQFSFFGGFLWQGNRGRGLGSGFGFFGKGPVVHE